MTALVLVEPFAAPADTPAVAHRVRAGACMFADQRPLELRQHAEDVEPELADAGVGVGLRLLQVAQPDTLRRPDRSAAQLAQFPGSTAGSPSASLARRCAGVSACHAMRKRAFQPQRLLLSAQAAQNSAIRTPYCQGRVSASQHRPRPVMVASASAGDPFGPGCRDKHRAPASRVSALRASIPIANEVSAHAAYGGPRRANPNPWPDAFRASLLAMSFRSPPGPRLANSS